MIGRGNITNVRSQSSATGDRRKTLLSRVHAGRMKAIEERREMKDLHDLHMRIIHRQHNSDAFKTQDEKDHYIRTTKRIQEEEALAMHERHVVTESMNMLADVREMTPEQKDEYRKDSDRRIAEYRAQQAASVAHAVQSTAPTFAPVAPVLHVAKSKRALDREQDKIKLANYKYPERLIPRPRSTERGNDGPIGNMDVAMMVFTPVNLIKPESFNGKLAGADYRDQEEKMSTGGAMYDIPANSPIRVGHGFGFVQAQIASGVNIVEFFRIEEIKSAEHRLDTWTIESHANRKVVVLSKYIGWAKWTDVAQSMGFKVDKFGKYRLQDTRASVWDSSIPIVMDGTPIV